MPSFTDIRVEAYVSGAWVNLTPDVMTDPKPRGSKGSKNNKPEAHRLADRDTFEFSLKNGTTNSGGVNGYYSPTHSNVLTGWDTGLPVRLSFSYAGFTKYKFYGHIEPDGITVIPGEVNDRRVDVSCHGFFGRAAYHRMNLIQPQTNKTAQEAVELIFDNLAIEPLEVEYGGIAGTDAAVISETMPYIFDNLGTETTALSELNKIAISKGIYIYIQGDDTGGETMRVDKTIRSFVMPEADTTDRLLLENGDSLLLENGDFLLLDSSEVFSFTEDDFGYGSEISYGKHIYNQITTILYPRRIDAVNTNVLFTLEKATELPALGRTLVFRGAYKDPLGISPKINGTDMITPVSGTDYEAWTNDDGTGTDRTASLGLAVSKGAAETEFTVTNNHATDTIYIGGPDMTFQIRGRGIHLDDPIRIVTQDSASIATHGVRPLTIDQKYANDVEAAMDAADNLITEYATGRYFVDKLVMTANKNDRNMLAFLFAEPYMNTNVVEASMAQISGNLLMIGYDFEIEDGDTVRWYPIFADIFQAAPGG